MIGMFDAFQNRNFRIYFSGQFFSLAGTWMQRVAEAWLAYQLTESAFMLGLVAFTGLFPGVFSNFFAGALIDRIEKRKIVIIAQILLSVQAAILCVLTLTGTITIHLLISLSIVQAVIAGFDMPARQSFLVDVVGKGQLSKAIAMNSLIVNAGRIVGPLLAGILIPTVGEGLTFGINSLSYLVLIGFLLVLNPSKSNLSSRRNSLLNDIKFGFSYLARQTDMRNFLILFGSANLFGMFYAALLPVLTVEKFGYGAEGLSLLFSASGFGALVGAFGLGSWVKVKYMRQMLVIGAHLLAFAILLLSIVPNLWLALPVLFIGGVGMMILISGTNIFLQSETRDHIRGRVMSFYTFTFSSATPVGSLIAGWLAEHVFTEFPFLLGGLLLFLIANYYYRNSLPLDWSVKIFIHKLVETGKFKIRSTHA